MLHDILMSARAPEEQNAPQAGRWTTAQHEGHLLVFYPSELREAVTTVHGTSDAVHCHRVVDLDTQEVFEGALIFGAALVYNIKVGVPDAAVIGRLNKTSKGAWVLTAHSPEELNTAQRWESENLT